MNAENDGAYLRHIESHQYWRLQYFALCVQFLKADVGIAGSKASCEGGRVGGGQWQFYKFAKYTTTTTTTQTIHNLWHLWAWFGGFRGRFTGKLFYFSEPSRKINTALREAEGFNPPPNQIVTKRGRERKSWIWLKLTLQVSIADLPNRVLPQSMMNEICGQCLLAPTGALYETMSNMKICTNQFSIFTQSNATAS